MPDVAAGEVYQRAWRFSVRALAVIAVLFGAALLAGGADRFNYTPSLAAAASAPGGYITWGAAAVVLGVLTLAESARWHRRAVMVGLLTLCTYYAFFAASIGISAWQDHHAALTGAVIYSGYSALCAIAYVAGHELRKATR